MGEGGDRSIRAAFLETWQLAGALAGSGLLAIVSVGIVATKVGRLAAVGLGIGLALLAIVLLPRAWRYFRPRVLLQVGLGPPYDDTDFGHLTTHTVLSHEMLSELLRSTSRPRDVWAYAKKIRLVVEGGTVTIVGVRLADSPLGEPLDLSWYSASLGGFSRGERRLHPADRNCFFALPGQAFGTGRHEIRIEVTRADRARPLSFRYEMDEQSNRFPILRQL
jgi:hypothetical protein